MGGKHQHFNSHHSICMFTHTHTYPRNLTMYSKYFGGLLFGVKTHKSELGNPTVFRPIIINTHIWKSYVCCLFGQIATSFISMQLLTES